MTDLPGDLTNGPPVAGAIVDAVALKVSARSHPTSVAGAIAGVMRQQGVVELQVVGAGALNQAVKAVAIAHGFLAEAGLDLVCTPAFADIEIDGERRTAMKLTVDDRGRRTPPPQYQPPPYLLDD